MEETREVKGMIVIKVWFTSSKERVTKDTYGKFISAPVAGPARWKTAGYTCLSVCVCTCGRGACVSCLIWSIDERLVISKKGKSSWDCSSVWGPLIQRCVPAIQNDWSTSQKSLGFLPWVLYWLRSKLLQVVCLAMAAITDHAEELSFFLPFILNKENWFVTGSWEQNLEVISFSVAGSQMHSNLRPVHLNSAILFWLVDWNCLQYCLLLVQ